MSVVPQLSLPHSLIVCIVHKCSLCKEKAERYQTTYLEKGERKILQGDRQMDVFEYYKDKSKYGVTGIALKSHPENVALTFMGISNKQSVGRHRLRLCQQTKAIDP